MNRQPRIRKVRTDGSSSNSELLDLWALLGSMDGARLKAVSRKLEQSQCEGHRCYCDLRRAVRLDELEEAEREVRERDQEVSDDEVWPTKPKRRWIRKIAAVDEG